MKRFSIVSSNGVSKEYETLLDAIQAAFVMLYLENYKVTVTIVDNFHVEPDYHSVMLFDKVPTIQIITSRYMKENNKIAQLKKITQKIFKNTVDELINLRALCHPKSVLRRMKRLLPH